MFDILDIEKFIHEERLYPVKNPNIDLPVEELLKLDDGLFSKVIFGERLSDDWYLKLAYIHLNVYMPKFPIFQIIRSINIVKQFRSKLDSYLDLEQLKIVSEPNNNTITFTELVTKSGWTKFINALISKDKLSKSIQLLKEYVDKYGVDYLLTNKVLVLPPGFRDFKVSDGGRVLHHEITEAYARLLTNNNKYNKTNLAALSIYQAYDNLFNVLIKKFSGKESLLRNTLASKIVNTATRSVIVPNDNLGLDEIGIPFKALIAMYAAEITYVILNKYKDKWLEITSTAKNIKIGASTGDIIKILKKISKGYDLPKYVYDFFYEILEKEILPNAVVIYKRDPALHKSSFLAARPRIAQSDAIEINTAVCAPLGGDFDGDSVIGTVNLKVVNKETGETKIWKNQDLALFPLMSW